jgi:hypothetical protein
MNNVTLEKLEKKFPGEGEERLTELLDIAWGGTDPTSGGQDIHYYGGFDIKGVLDEDNEAVSKAEKKRIRELVGMAADEAPAEGESSASTMKNTKPAAEVKTPKGV